jgi:O-antigen/teichoic acid export membrane protein
MKHGMLLLAAAGFIGYLPGYFFVSKVIPSTYIPVLPLTIIAYIGNIFLFGTYFLQCLAQYKKKTLFLSTSLCLSGFLSLILTYFLISRYGLSGAACSTCVAYGMYFMLCYKYNRRLQKTEVLS